MDKQHRKKNVLQILKEGPKVEIHPDALKITFEKYQFGNFLA